MRTTIEIDDSLLKATKKLAIDRSSTLRALVEEALRRLLEGEGAAANVELPKYDGPPLPPDFPWRSGKAMLEYLEGPDASP